MPTQDNHELPHVFDADGARRIVDVVRRIENMPRNLRRPQGDFGMPAPQPFWLAQNSAYQANGANATTWTIYTSAGASKGSEAATSITSFAKNVYVRKGLCYANVTYSLYWVDGNWEVLNPTLSGIGKSNTSIAKSSGAANNVDIYAGTSGSETSISQTLTAWNRYAAVASGKWVRWAWNDDSKAFDLVAAEC